MLTDSMPFDEALNRQQNTLQASLADAQIDIHDQIESWTQKINATEQHLSGHKKVTSGLKSHLADSMDEAIQG